LPSTIEQVHREYADRGLVVLPISIEEGRRRVSGWADGQRLTLPLLLDPDGDVSAAYGITATPTAFLIGADGRLLARGVGTKAWLSEPGRALLWRLLPR
jgi:cytochrome c biogenesis protein CcmG/thiol:disulfide interchange protein DsbE